MRVNFRKKTKDLLAKRAGFLCSNPECKNQTVGPSSLEASSINLGVAAHISAASPKGARYNSQISDSERITIDNGIWLCSNCSILIDRDKDKYTMELLYEWKKKRELEVSITLKSNESNNTNAKTVRKNQLNKTLQFRKKLKLISGINFGESVDILKKNDNDFIQFIIPYSIEIFHNSIECFLKFKNYLSSECKVKIETISEELLQEEDDLKSHIAISVVNQVKTIEEEFKSRFINLNVKIWKYPSIIENILDMEIEKLTAELNFLQNK